MASAFSHIAVPIALKIVFAPKHFSWRLLFLGLFLSIAPDLDSIAFRFGIPYESQWGHRGFTHSIAFAIATALLCTYFSKSLKSSRWAVLFVTFISMVSHGVLDAITTGGLGVAFFWPLNSERYFLPWKVVQVSPLSVSRFFTERGVEVLKSEFIYIWMPCLVMAFSLYLFRRLLSVRSLKK